MSIENNQLSGDYNDRNLLPTQRTRLFLQSLPTQVANRTLRSVTPDLAMRAEQALTGAEVELFSQELADIQYSSRLFLPSRAEPIQLAESETDILSHPSPIAIPRFEPLTRQHPSLLRLGAFLKMRYAQGFSHERMPAGSTRYSETNPWGWELDPEVFEAIVGYTPDEFVLPDGYPEESIVPLVLAVEHSSWLQTPPIMLANPSEAAFVLLREGSFGEIKPTQPTQALHAYLEAHNLPLEAFMRNMASWKQAGMLYDEITDLTSWDTFIRLQKRFHLFKDSCIRDRTSDLGVENQTSIRAIVTTLERQVAQDFTFDLKDHARRKRRTPRQVAAMINNSFRHVPSYHRHALVCLDSIAPLVQELGITPSFVSTGHEQVFTWAVEEALQEGADEVIPEEHRLVGEALRGFHFWHGLSSSEEMVAEYAKAVAETKLVPAHHAIHSAQRIARLLTDTPISALSMYPVEVIQDILYTTGEISDRTALEHAIDILKTSYGLASAITEKQLAASKFLSTPLNHGQVIMETSQWIHLPEAVANKPHSYAKATIQELQMLAKVTIRDKNYAELNRILEPTILEEVRDVFRFKPQPVQRFYQALSQLDTDNALWVLVAYGFVSLASTFTLPERFEMTVRQAKKEATLSLEAFKSRAERIVKPAISPADAGKMLAALKEKLLEKFPAIEL